MSSSTDAALTAKLAALGRRWRRMVTLRGLSAALVTGLGGLIFLAALDRFVVMPDGLRIGLTAAAYAMTLGIFWWLGGRHLLRAPDAHALARIIEHAAPRLRGELLSALELGETRGQWDSPVFRALVQKAAAEHLRDVEPAAVLPRRLIVRWALGALAVTALLAALLALPALRFPQLLLRAAAPMLDLERVSTIRIAILTPGPGDTLVPRGDAVTVSVGISGGQPREVLLELLRPGRRPERIAMAPTGAENQFAAAVPMEDDTVGYRIRAGDARTRRLTLTSRARPQILTFTKTYTFPDYTKLAPRTVTDSSGDLAGLEGAMVDLAIEVDQRVRSGDLKLNLGKSAPFIALTPAGSNRLTARVPLQLGGTYRVHLVAADTGFENKFGGEYEIKPQPDLVPQVEITKPKENLVAAPDDVIELQGLAKDDIGLASVAQLVRVNSNAWSEFPFPGVTNTEALLARQWNLLDLGAHAGDQVTTKLVAVDLKGSRTETAPLQVTLVSSSFDISRVKTVEARRRALRSTAAFGTAVREADAGRNAKETPALLAGALAALPGAADKAWQDLKIAVRMARAGREASELTFAGAYLAQARALLAADGNFTTGEKPAAKDKPPARELDQTLKSLGTLAGHAANAESLMRDLLGAEEVDVAMEKLRDVQNNFARMADRAAKLTPPNAEADATRRRRVAATELQTLEPLLDKMHANLPGNAAGQVKRVRDQLAKQRAALVPEESTKRKKQPVAPAPFNVVQQTLANALNELLNARNVATEHADRKLTALHTSAAKSTGRFDDVPRRIEDAKTTGEFADARVLWRGLAGELHHRAELEEIRTDADSLFVADLAKASQVLGALMETFRDPANAKAAGAAVRDLGLALKPLEAGHRVNELTLSVQALAEQERWEPYVPLAATARPKDWRWTADVLRAMPDTLRKAGLPDDIARRLEMISEDAPVREIAAEMDERYRTATRVRSIPDKLEKLLAELLRTAIELQPALAAAREKVSEAAPKLSDQLAALAETAAAMEKKTRDQNEAMPAQDDAKAREENRALSAAQTELLKAVDELRDALRRDANTQDMATKEGRERARDADDASAMLKDPPRKADGLLREAAAATKAEAAQKLPAAADQEKITADTLRQLAKHFKNTETGAAAASRDELRQAEVALGMKEQMDARDKQAELLADLAKLNQDEQLKKLEDELKENQPMQRELSTIAKNAVKFAAGELQQAAMDEKSLAAKVRADAAAEEQRRAETAKNLAQSAEKQTGVNATVSDASEALQRALRHESRMDANAVTPAPDQGQPKTPVPANPMAKLTDGVKNLSEQALPPVQKNIESAPNSASVTAPVQEAQRSIETSAAMLKAALGESMEGQQQQQKPGNDANAQQLARTLDRLDAAKNKPQPKPGQKNSQPPGNDAQQQMQQAMAEAQQAAKAQRAEEKLNETAGTGAQSYYVGKADKSGALPEAPNSAGGQWGKLPPQMAQQLLEGSRESVSGEYRTMVETYFKVVADRARGAKPQ